jgi:hypothetical protein
MHSTYNKGSGHICFNEVNRLALGKFVGSSHVAAVCYLTIERIKLRRSN